MESFKKVFYFPLGLKISQTIDELELELNNLGKIYCTCTVYPCRIPSLYFYVIISLQSFAFYFSIL